MPKNQGFVMTIKANDGTLVPLYPNTTLGQIIDLTLGEVYGPFTLTLSANNWVNNQQTLPLQGISSVNVPYCVKVLTGTPEQMMAQDEAYSLLDPITGIESLQNEIRFTCTSTPTVDFQVQVSWTV